jgi:hypothetical protein
VAQEADESFILILHDKRVEGRQIHDVCEL